MFVNHRDAVSATSPVSIDQPWCVYVTVTNAKLIIRVDGAVSLCVTEGRKCCNYCVNMFDVTLRVHPFGNFQLGVELVRVLAVPVYAALPTCHTGQVVMQV